MPDIVSRVAAELAATIEGSSRPRGRTVMGTVLDTRFLSDGWVSVQVGSSVVRARCGTLDNLAVGDEIYVRPLSADRGAWWIYDGYGGSASGGTQPSQNPATLPSHTHSHAALADVWRDQHHDEDHQLDGPHHTGDLSGARVSLPANNLGSHANLAEHVQDSEIHGAPYGAIQETPSGLVNGINTVFQTAYPFATGCLRVFYRRVGEPGFVRLKRGLDYYETTQGFTMYWAPESGDDLYVDYIFDTATVPPSPHAASHTMGADAIGWNDLLYMSSQATATGTSRVADYVAGQVALAEAALDAHVVGGLHHDQLHDLGSSDDHYGSLLDQKVELSSGNVGNHSSLYGHVMDQTLHGGVAGRWSRLQMNELRPRATDPASLAVYVEPGTGVIPGVGKVSYAGGQAALSPPTSQSRIDLVALTAGDGLTVIQGTAAGTPQAPLYPTDKMVLCEVFLAANATAVGDEAITDVRPFLEFPADLDFLPPTVQDDQYDTSISPASLADDLNQVRAMVRKIKDAAQSWLAAPVKSIAEIWAGLQAHIADTTVHGAGGPWYVRGGPRWFVSGTLQLGSFPVTQQMDNSGTLEKFRVRVGAGPVGAPLDVALKRWNDVLGTARIAAGYVEGETTSFSSTQIGVGDELGIEIIQVGLDYPGANLQAETVIRLNVTSA